jgi:hypothetical protein
MRNPEPIKRALRIERRRKFLGADRCFYCPEPRPSSLEREHPVGIQRDSRFYRAVCRNCHRDLEMRRDVAGLTKNGQHKRESRNGKRRAYMLLLAFDQDSIADAIESPYASNSLIAAALRATATSLRCRAVEFYPTGNSAGKKPRPKKTCSR